MKRREKRGINAAVRKRQGSQDDGQRYNNKGVVCAGQGRGEETRTGCRGMSGRERAKSSF